MYNKRITYLKTDGEDFVDYLSQWYQDLPTVAWKSLLKDAPAEQTAMVSVDIVNGFCKSGNLSSTRIASIIQPVSDLFRAAKQHKIEKFVLLQDTHPEHSTEFSIYPPHCIEGSAEAQTVPELLDLPGSEHFEILPKKTISPGLEPRFQEWLRKNDSVRQFILVGDCTDICIYQTAIFLKSWYVQADREVKVIVPENCVNTFDIPLDREKKGEVPPHPGEFMHVVFLYHLRLNGVRVVGQIK